MIFTLETLRHRLKQYHPPKNPHLQRKASVLIPLFEKEGELHLWLTERAAHLRVHSGQVAFPGGKQDPEDANEWQTALRESKEEIALEATDVELLGEVDQVLSKHLLLVSSFVGLVPETFVPQASPDEIADVFSVPLSFFQQEQYHHSREVLTPRNPEVKRFLIHHFDYQNYHIWGMTAFLILRFLEVGFGYQPPYDIHLPGEPTWMDWTQSRHEDVI